MLILIITVAKSLKAKQTEDNFIKLVDVQVCAIDITGGIPLVVPKGKDYKTYNEVHLRPKDVRGTYALGSGQAAFPPDHSM